MHDLELDNTRRIRIDVSIYIGRKCLTAGFRVAVRYAIVQQHFSNFKPMFVGPDKIYITALWDIARPDTQICDLC